MLTLREPWRVATFRSPVGVAMSLAAWVYIFGSALGCAGPSSDSSDSSHSSQETTEEVGVTRIALENDPTTCQDGVDGDLDGLIDCVDPDCSSVPACATVFACRRSPQFFATTAGTSKLFTVDTSTKPYGLTSGGDLGFVINGVGYNVLDGFFYGFRQTDDHLIKIGRGSSPNSVTTEDISTTATNTKTFSADFDGEGNLWVREGTRIHRIVVATGVKTTTSNANVVGNDLAYNPDDGKIYSYGRVGSDGVISVFNTKTLTDQTTAAGLNFPGGLTGEGVNANGVAYGAQWFDKSGTFFVSRNGDGAVFGINLRTKAVAYLGSTGAVAANDGSTCSYTASNIEACANSADDDHDGTTDENIAGSNTTPGDGCVVVADTDGDGVLDSFDLDDDNDGIPDVLETGDSDGDGIPDRIDLDSDNDGIPDAVEAGHGKGSSSNTALGCAKADVNADGLCTSVEVPPGDSNSLNYTPRDTDGDGVPDFRDLDSDNDGLTDAAEVGQGHDTDGDGIYDCPQGVGTNGLCDGAETMPDTGIVTYDGNAMGPDAPRDTDGDGVPDYRDLDSDNDGIDDVIEAGGVDQNGDGKLDPLDGSPDTNGNGLIDRVDPGEAGTALAKVDTDGDGVPDVRDLDSDNDGFSDLQEGGSGGTDTNDDGVIDGPDADGDGLQDSVDGFGGFGDAPGKALPDADGSGAPDYQSVDRDGDGSFDIAGGPNASLDKNRDGRIDEAGDADGDGIADVIDKKKGAFGGVSTIRPDGGPSDGGVDAGRFDAGRGAADGSDDAGVSVNQDNGSLEGGGLSCGMGPAPHSAGLGGFALFVSALALARRRSRLRAAG